MSQTITSPISSPVLRRPSTLRRKAEELLAQADIRVNGGRPWDMQLKDPRVLERALAHGSLALGESYVKGDWDARQLDEFFAKLLRARLHKQIDPLALLFPILRDRLFNRQNAKRVWQVGKAHYDLGNEFYEAMLDPRMAYSCGYWQKTDTLAEAQEAKLDLICRKLRLEPGMRLLDIGCGWGSLMAYAAEHYGVHCLGVTISEEQAAFARQRYPDLDLDIRLQDYRELDETFDRIASVGMFEHVGHKNYRSFMETAHRCLADDGIFLLHTIGKNLRSGTIDPWIEKHIFPNGELPSIGHVSDAADELFIVEDLHNFGADYDMTLMAWHRNFEKAWPRFEAELGEGFRRKWRYYLLSCAGAFRARHIQLWQWTLCKQGLLGGCPRVS